MTVEEFKEKYPQLAHLEGNDLWDAMENAVMIESGTPVLSGKEAEDYFKEHFCTDEPLKFENYGFLIPSGTPSEQPIKITYKPNE